MVNTNPQRLKTIERRLSENSGDPAGYLVEAILRDEGEQLVERARELSDKKNSNALLTLIKLKVRQRLADHDPSNPKIKAIKAAVTRELFDFLNDVRIQS